MADSIDANSLQALMIRLIKNESLRMALEIQALDKYLQDTEPTSSLLDTGFQRT